MSYDISSSPSNSRGINSENLDSHNTYVASPNYQEDFKLMSNGQIAMSSTTINFASATPDPGIFPFEAFKSALNEVLQIAFK